jgi:hypothetical protein
MIRRGPGLREHPVSAILFAGPATPKRGSIPLCITEKDCSEGGRAILDQNEGRASKINGGAAMFIARYPAARGPLLRLALVFAMAVSIAALLAVGTI